MNKNDMNQDSKSGNVSTGKLDDTDITSDAVANRQKASFEGTNSIDQNPSSKGQGSQVNATDQSHNKQSLKGL